MNLKELREQCVTDKNEFHPPATVLALLDVIEEMRGALKESTEVLALSDLTGRPDLKVPEDAVVKPICEEWGYGAVMDSAFRLWVKKHGGSAFTCGACVFTVEDALELNRRALAKLKVLENE